MKWFAIYWRTETPDGNIAYEYVTEVKAETHEEAIEKAEEEIVKWYRENVEDAYPNGQTFLCIAEDEGLTFNL